MKDKCEKGHKVNTFTGVCFRCGWQAKNPPIDAVIAHFKRLDEAVKSAGAAFLVLSDGLAATSERLQEDLERIKKMDSEKFNFNISVGKV